jgi:hypothetical protein
MTIAAVHIDSQVAMAFAMFVFATAVGVCMVLLMVYDRPFDAGGFAIDSTVLRDVMPD